MKMPLENPFARPAAIDVLERITEAPNYMIIRATVGMALETTWREFSLPYQPD